jgi:hypothetical protein
MAEELDRLPNECAGSLLAQAFRALNEVILKGRKNKVTKSQYVMFLMADMMTWCEVANALCRKAAGNDSPGRSSSFMKAAARLFVRETIEKVYVNGLKIAHGCAETIDEIAEKLNALNIGPAMKDNLNDMDVVAAELVK